MKCGQSPDNCKKPETCQIIILPNEKIAKLDKKQCLPLHKHRQVQKDAAAAVTATGYLDIFQKVGTAFVVTSAHPVCVAQLNIMLYMCI